MSSIGRLCALVASFVSLAIAVAFAAEPAPRPLDPFWATASPALQQELRYWDDYFASRWLDRGARPPRGSGYKPYQRWKWMIERRLDENGSLDPTARWREHLAQQSLRSVRLQAGTLAPPPQWTSLGPSTTAGRVLAHAFDPSDARTLWVGSASGGLWRTQDEGETWQPMTDHLPSLSVSAVAIHPFDGNTILIGTGEGFGGTSAEGVGVLKSTDGGLSWHLTSFSYGMVEAVCSFALAWDPLTPSTVYLAANNGLWVSHDTGDSWSLLKPGRFVGLVIDKSDPRRLYAADVVNGPNPVNHIWRSADGGAGWTALADGLPTVIGFTSLAICDANPLVLYAGIAQPGGALQGVYKTVDGGDHWEILANAPNYVCYQAPWVGCQGWYANVVAVSAGDPNLVFLGGIHLYRSLDGGASWSVTGGTFPGETVHVDQHGFAFHPDQPATIFALNDGGVFRSTDLGLSWEPKNEGLVTFQYYSVGSSPHDPTLISGGSQDNGTHLTDLTGGNTVSGQWGPFADGGVSVFDHQHEGVIHGEEQLGTHFKTTDGGATWHYTMNGISEIGEWITPVAMDPVDANILHTSSRNWLYRTFDGGESWQAVMQAAKITSITVDRVDPNLVYAGSFFDSAIYRSLDRGTTWTRVPAPWIFGLSDLEPDPSQTGVLVATLSSYSVRPRVYRSTDRGQTWTNLTHDLPVIPINCATVSRLDPEDLFVGTDLGVYRWRLGSSTWEPYNGNLPNVMVLDMHDSPADSTLRVGTHGRGAWKTALPIPAVTTVEPGAADNRFEIGPVRPNPFTSSAAISYRLAATCRVDLGLYDLAGRRVRTLIDGLRWGGAHTQTWDGRDRNGRLVPPGVYLCRLKATPIGGPSAGVVLHAKLLNAR